MGRPACGCLGGGGVVHTEVALSAAEGASRRGKGRGQGRTCILGYKGARRAAAGRHMVGARGPFACKNRKDGHGHGALAAAGTCGCAWKPGAGRGAAATKGAARAGLLLRCILPQLVDQIALVRRITSPAFGCGVRGQGLLCGRSGLRVCVGPCCCSRCRCMHALLATATSCKHHVPAPVRFVHSCASWLHQLTRRSPCDCR